MNPTSMCWYVFGYVDRLNIQVGADVGENFLIA
jgi:hypothetical protein